MHSSRDYIRLATQCSKRWNRRKVNSMREYKKKSRVIFWLILEECGLYDLAIKNIMLLLGAPRNLKCNICCNSHYIFQNHQKGAIVSYIDPNTNKVRLGVIVRSMKHKVLLYLSSTRNRDSDSSETDNGKIIKIQKKHLLKVGNY